MNPDPVLVQRVAEELTRRDHRAPCVFDTARIVIALVQEGGASASSDGARPTSRTGTGTSRAIIVLERNRNKLREALLELHSAGLALAPLVPPVDASVSVRWDEAMGAADDVLCGRVASTERAA